MGNCGELVSSSDECEKPEVLIPGKGFFLDCSRIIDRIWSASEDVSNGNGRESFSNLNMQRPQGTFLCSALC